MCCQRGIADRALTIVCFPVPTAIASCAWADSNGVSKAPRLRAAGLTEATAGASDTAARPARRAAVNGTERRPASDQRIRPVAAAPMAMMAGTSQPGARADEDTNQAA